MYFSAAPEVHFVNRTPVRDCQLCLDFLHFHISAKMTGAAEGIGAANGTAGLFNTAITWFDYINVAKQADTRLESLLVKLDNAQLRLTRWGKAMGLTGS